MARLSAWLLAATLALPLLAHAQSFRCVGKDGKKYYGSAVPPQCAGQPVEQLNAQGKVMKRIDPVADEKTREAQQAEAARKKQEEAAQRADARKAATRTVGDESEQAFRTISRDAEVEAALFVSPTMAQ